MTLDEARLVKIGDSVVNNSNLYSYDRGDSPTIDITCRMFLRVTGIKIEIQKKENREKEEIRFQTDILDLKKYPDEAFFSHYYFDLFKGPETLSAPFTVWSYSSFGGVTRLTQREHNRQGAILYDTTITF